MKRAAISLTMALVAPWSFASDWVEVARSKVGDTVYEYRVESIDIEESAGNAMATAVFRVIRLREATKFFKEKVAHSACRAGYGSLATYNLSNTLVTQTDYVDGGGNVGSAIAEFVCEKARQRAINAVIQQAAPNIDYVSDNAAAKTFDSLHDVVMKDPAHKNRSIDWIAFETHRLVMAAQKKGAI